MTRWILPLLLVCEIVALAPLSLNFESVAEFQRTAGLYAGDLLAQAAPLLVLAAGMTLVLSLGAIDLSVGSMTVLIACVMSQFPGDASFWWTALPAGLLLGMALGGLNGVLIARFDVPPIIATLGTMFFYRGLSDVVMRGTSRSPFYDVPHYEFFGEWTGSLAVACVLVVFGGGWYRTSRWRREILMIGGNRVAARYAGLRVGRRTFEVFALMGLFAFVAAVCATARSESISASELPGLELQVIVAVVLGGTLVEGGSATLAGSITGVFLVAVLKEGLRGAATHEERLPIKLGHLELILLGALLIVGVWLHGRAKGRREVA